MKAKNTLITDLDNTLFDWVDVWVACFSTMLDEVVKISGVPREVLLPEMKAVHQKHGTAEYSFLLEELPSLTRFLQGRPARLVLSGPIESYRAERKKRLQLYPTVAETLLRIKGKGTKIVGYTESMAFYSNYRVRCLGLDGVLDTLFCPEDHIVPAELRPEDYDKYPAQRRDLRFTAQDYTPKGSKKPDADVLSSIIAKIGATADQCVYIGDSLTKDVGMAIDCKVADVWAQYGVAHERSGYELLRAVTHWTLEDVEREKQIRTRDAKPSHTLETEFGELLRHFEFMEFEVSEAVCPKLEF